MKIGGYNSRTCGRVDVDLQNIDRVFSFYQKEYSEIFRFNSNQIDSIRKFKMKTGGELIAFKSANKTLALITFRNINRGCKELGDVMKLVPMFSRCDFAKGLSIASRFLADKGYCIIGYPNKYALPMELQAGYQILRRYDKVNYLVLLGCALLLPLDVRDRKLKINFNLFRTAPLVMFGIALRKTKLRIRILRVYAASNKSFKIKNILNFGILYKYIIGDNGKALPIIFYGDCSPDKIPLGFEHSDNSA